MPNLTLPTPDDWHLHLRDGAALPDVVPHTSAGPSSCPICSPR